MGKPADTEGCDRSTGEIRKPGIKSPRCKIGVSAYQYF